MATDRATVCHPWDMPPDPTAPGLMRSLGLDVDGPVLWGQSPTTRSAGLFAVETPTPTASAPLDQDALRRWLELVPSLRLDGEPATPATLARRLASFWVSGASLLYVGRSNRSLAARVSALYATELGYRRPHAGGHWLKTLREPGRLNVWWAETDAAEEYEDAVLDAFAASLPEGVRTGLSLPYLPWANLEAPAGVVRSTGLADELLNAEPAPGRSSGVRRSDSSTPARRTPVSATRSPRATRAARPRSTKGDGRRDEPTPVTAEGLTAMEAELERLRTIERPAVVARIVHARELGDLRENADYEAARREQSFLEGRVQELERRLRTAVIIQPQARGGVALGSRVRFELDGEPGELTIVGSSEADPGLGRVSSASPVGRALMGRRAGDLVEVVTPSRRLHYRVLEVG
jgi:transcription elongation factor GreA